MRANKFIINQLSILQITLLVTMIDAELLEMLMCGRVTFAGSRYKD